ncbi:putative ABC transporter [Trypanosoma rangeli]|uniref:Putative ABC transporter n=1 Tax=Trypanosoma rangeli TaxID=5698 RepID=A0A422N357_TRYRA|nr:putative ABC transporter [Trypanosoma rangeli]RNE99895.1 putative ABC transporter [Trypanosoma rangeli]|eukprot:RNE99895.1 putative ABC transporter [Trypanosoma rangeli]
MGGKELLHPNVLLCSVTVSLSLAVVVRWLMDRWGSPMRLRNRVILLCTVRKIVQDWEEACLREVEKQMTASATDEAHDRLLFRSHEESGRAKSNTTPFHGVVCSMAYAPAVNLSQWLRLWRVGRHLCASVVEDMLLLQRLGYIIKFVAFRRLTLMAEVRYYAALWHRALYGDDGEKMGIGTPMPRMPSWLVGQRPFWIVPLSRTDSGRFLCLPLSHFPVETILTSTAEESWIRDLVDVLPLLTEEVSVRFIPDMLRTMRTLRLLRRLVQWKFPLQWQRLWNEIDRLFLTYAAPLAREQLQRREAACRRFYEEKLFEGVELVTGEGVDMEDEETGLFSLKRRRRNRRVGCDVLLRDAADSRRLQVLLRLRSLSHAARVGINLMAPQSNFFAEWMLFTFLSSATSDVGREQILMEFSGHVIWGSLAAIVKAVMWSLDDAVKAKICILLRTELHYELNVKLATADEAFLRRCIEGGITGRDNPVEKSSAYAEHVASQILGQFDYEQQRFMARVAVVLFSMWRREACVAVFAAIVAMFDYHATAYAFSCWLGITVSKEMDHELARMEEEGSPPSEPRYGLRLMLDVLAEAEGRKEEGMHRRYRRKTTFHPCLALIVCGGTFVLDWPVSASPHSGGKGEAIAMQHLKLLEIFLDEVINDGSYALATKEESPAAWQKNIGLSSLVQSLKQNAAFVRGFVLNSAAVQASGTAVTNVVGRNESGQGHVMDRNTEVILHPEEIALLNDPQGMRHIPQTLSFDDVFDKPSRFILRQLGLETVFAHTAATAVKQRGCRSIKESLFDFVSGPFHNVFARTFVQLMEFTERVFFYAAFSPDVKLPWISWPIVRQLSSVASCGTEDYRVAMSTIDGLSTVSLWSRMSGYRVALKKYGDYNFGPPFCLAMQLSRHLPTNLHDASPIHYAPLLVKRRQAWSREIQAHGKLEVDNIGRIVGGFSLLKSITFRGVYFVYPQLHHCVRDGSLQPTLSNITAEFLAGHKTAIIGPTGSGKSTIISLIKRIYDPVPHVHVNEACDAWCDSRALVKVLRHCLCASLPIPTEETAENIILLDGIPMGCFSTSYLRSAIGMLEQAPCIFEELTYLQNFSLFAPGVSMEEVVAVAKLCGCDSFVESCALAYEGLVGPLSAGEKQRLALARAMLIGCRGSGVFLFDEPTARLDGHNESLVEEAMEGLLGPPHRMTVLVVSHRLSTLRSATHAVVLNGGRLEFHGLLKGAAASSHYVQRAVEAQDLRD